MSEFRIRSCSYYILMTSLTHNSDGLYKQPLSSHIRMGCISQLERVESRDPWTEFSMSASVGRLGSTPVSSFTSKGNQATPLMRTEINGSQF